MPPKKKEQVLRTPPFNNEAEQALLACLLIEDSSFDKIFGTLEAADFYVPNNGIIFNCIKKLHESGEPYDITFVSSALRAEGKFEQIGGMEYLMGLTYIIPNASNIGYYAQQIKDKAKLRELYNTATNIQELVYEYDQDITRDATEALDESGQMIFELAKEGSARDPQPMEKIVTEVFEDMEERFKSEDKNFGIQTGFYDLDGMINGLQPGALAIIAARPGMGKTSFALNIAQNAALKGKTVAIFSLEMTSSQLVQRIISAEAEVSSRDIQNGSLKTDDWQKLANVADIVSKMNIFIDDTSSIPVMEIRSKCRRLKSNKECGLDMIIIDYLQLMENKRIESREQQIADISRNLKNLAKELEIPVIALSQLNRQLESRSDKRPMMSDIRESGAIEQDADLIMFIYRDEYYNKESTQRNIAEIIIGKNRNGPTGNVKLLFMGEFTKFKNPDRAVI